MILTDEQDEANNLAIINNTIQVRKEVPRATSMRAQRQTGEHPLLVPGTWRGKNECGSNGQTLPLTIYTPLEDWKAAHAQYGGTSAHTLLPSML